MNEYFVYNNSQFISFFLLLFTLIIIIIIILNKNINYIYIRKF
jgi:hypothetical protein